MNRRAGIAGIRQRQELQVKFQQKKQELAGAQITNLSAQLEMFRTKLEEFTMKHKDEIRKNSQFRRQFQDMCATVGVDPLASSKGFWAEKLGIGEFYYQLSIKIIEVCLSTASTNGGIITVDDLRNRLVKLQPKNQKDSITLDDVICAVKKLKSLGHGFGLIPLGAGRYLVQSVPGVLSTDDTQTIQLAEENGCFVTRELMMDRLCWDDVRISIALDRLLKDGRVWVDDQARDTPQYYFPSLFVEQYNAITGTGSASVSGSSLA